MLFPAIIFKEIAAADFSRRAGAADGGRHGAGGDRDDRRCSVLFSRPLMAGLGINGPQFTSLVQGAARWHTFIAFAIIPLQFGAEALSLGAVSAAAMTPLLNILCVIVMARFAHETYVDAAASCCCRSCATPSCSPRWAALPGSSPGWNCRPWRCRCWT